MKRKYSKQELAMKVYEELLRTYGSPNRTKKLDPLSELIYTILSQHTSDKNRDRAFEKLKETFPSFESILSSPLSKLANVIRVGGLGKVKAARIKSVLQTLKTKFGKISLDFLRDYSKEKAEQFLLSLPGVGPKTAACVLLFSLNKPAFPVDTHIYRVTRRLGLIENKISAEKAQKILEKLVPSSFYRTFHLSLIRFGRETCRAYKPLCVHCFLRNFCSYYNKRLWH